MANDSAETRDHRESAAGTQTRDHHERAAGAQTRESTGADGGDGNGADGIWDGVKQTFSDFAEDECPRMAAALAYYTIFALPPLLVLLTLAAVAAGMDSGQVQGGIIEQASGLIGEEGARQIRTMLQEADRPGGGLLPTILSGAALLFGATGAFLQLQGALNRAWEVKPKGGGVKGFFLKRLFSFGMIMAFGFLFLVGLVVSAAISAFAGQAVDMVQGTALGAIPPDAFSTILTVVDLLLSVVVIALLVGVLFKVVPDARIAWEDVRIGAIGTAVLLVLGKLAIGFYLGRSNPGSAYGAAGSLAVILVWIYYSSMILLLGAEFTQVWARRAGRHIEPSEGAIKLKKA